MAHRTDSSRGRDIVARWCVLAEQRLGHLTELYETGRWRRYHTESAFLENIREAKAAVETWRGLVTREASLNNSSVDMSWLGHIQAALPQRDPLYDQARPPAPEHPPMAAEPAPRVISEDVLAALESELIALHEAPPAPVADETAPGPDLDLMQRYPLLRNAL